MGRSRATEYSDDVQREKSGDVSVSPGIARSWRELLGLLALWLLLGAVLVGAVVWVLLYLF